MEDPDAPMVNPFVHWLLYGLPATMTSLPEGIPVQQQLPQLGGAVQGQNDAKTHGWYGPKPPLGHGVHHYHFQIFALDIQLNLGQDATLKELTDAMRGHVIADGASIGTYERTADSD